ncbi:hypothetical protein B484DRAFT_448000 [Ochromonadaceae sp. CCMP2298]|jgi:hypothetical protein|nr:hypothetical protein B484DRAFT_448000 [Ochromonadaceae sp. CCMP2298]|eukprot:CAMPEP_0173212476 /NCGR_PEP_ID=MMETSP1141-20130122/24819_1 /TAXON_ID=483371 /ORGANISM="non described non described, Strain CCMP2298" /LENGTH=67 /DNA_ID=CAMNT_0014139495 /DNA_START=74 /DNA_END=277 /DNA_ORIENTATION=-
MENGDDTEIIDKICDYAKENHIKEILQEYLKRIVVQKPVDVIAFLIKEIQENPCVLEKESAGGPATG